MRVFPAVRGGRADRGRKATVKVLKSTDRWYGITYKEDKEMVVEAIRKLKEEGVYPQHLWKAE